MAIHDFYLPLIDKVKQMKKNIIFTLALIALITSNSWAQEQSFSRTNKIRSGFYLRLGPVIPIGLYASGQTVPSSSGGLPTPTYFLPAKTGAAMDVGYLIYIGPAFANKFLRAGIDATFLSFSFNTTKPNVTENEYKYWYYYGGQKFGPLITINPIDKLMIDLSYKLNAYVVYTDSKGWGHNFTQNEVSMNIRYSIMMVSFQYNFGKANFTAFDSSNPNRYMENNTIRFLIGLKF